MNWIDDKYKETLGNKKFPSSLKEAGWKSAQAMLDKEFPVAPVRGAFIGGKYIALAAALLLIPATIWYFNNPTVLPAAKGSKPNEQIQADSQNDDASKTISAEDVEMSNSTSSNLKNELKTDEISRSSKEDLVVEKDEISGSKNRSTVSSSMDRGDGNSRETPEIENGLLNNPTSGNLPDSPATEEGGNTTEPAFEQENRVGDPVVSKPISDEGFGDSDTPEKEPSSTLNSNGNSEGADATLTKGNENPDSQNPGDQNPDDQNKSPETPEPEKSPELPEGKLNNENKNEGIEPNEDGQKTPTPDETSVEKKDSLDLPKMNTPPSNTGTNMNSGAKSTLSRKEHFAFLELPDDALSNYQLFSRERFSVSTWAGYSFVNKFLDADNAAYLDKRRVEEKAIWTYSSGFKLDYFLDNHWTFGFGIGWSEYGEDLAYNISQRDTSKIDGRVSSPANFSNIVQVDSMRIITGINQGHWNYTLITEDTDSSVQANNGRTSWQYLEIPFTIGYRFGSGRIKPWLKTGLSFGIPISNNFRYLNEEATNLSDARLSSSEWVAPVQYNYLFEAGLDCFITRSFSVRVNAISSFQLNSSFQQFSDVRQQYYRLGMSVGLAYNF